MTRAFVAIRPPGPVLDAIEARRARALAATVGARPATRDQWHVTLQFLGNDADVDAVMAVFADEPLDAGARDIGLGGAEALGNARRARILALGLREGAEWIRQLGAQVEHRLARLGHVRDDGKRPFVPHLTLARFREPTDLRPLRASIGREPVGPSWRVDEVVLFESLLRPEGAEHIVRSNIPTGV